MPFSAELLNELEYLSDIPEFSKLRVLRKYLKENM